MISVLTFYVLFLWFKFCPNRLSIYILYTYIYFRTVFFRPHIPHSTTAYNKLQFRENFLHKFVVNFISSWSVSSKLFWIFAKRPKTLFQYFPHFIFIDSIDLNAKFLSWTLSGFFSLVINFNILIFPVRLKRVEEELEDSWTSYKCC